MNGKENKKNLLEKLYIEQELSTRDIANILGVGQTTVRRYLKKYNIPTRTLIESINTKAAREKKERANEALRVNEVRYCIECGSEFIVKPHMDKKFCDTECMGKAYSRKYSNRKIVPCGYCGTELERILSRVKAHQKQFCDHKCHGKWKSQNLIGPNSPTYKRLTVPCGYCTDSITVTLSQFRSHEKHYCDTDCMALDYSYRFSGKNSPTWQGGKINRNGYGLNWGRMRRLAMERDGHSCQLCGKSEEENMEELSVHHIRNFRNFEDYKAANDLSNLVSLCRECHTFVHSNSNVNKIFIIEG